MQILVRKRKDKKLDEFHKRAWHHADMEHYGKDSDWKTENFTVVAKEKGEIVGSMTFRIDVGVLWLGTMIVAPDKKRQGVGKQLMQKMEMVAKEKNIHKIHFVTGKNWQSVRFYESLGYKITAEHPKHYMHIDWVEFTKFL